MSSQVLVLVVLVVVIVGQITKLETMLMLLYETAFHIINDRIPNTFEDILEAYQFINDYGYTDKLNSRQMKILEEFVENGAVITDPFHI
jgi:hypothetical protein